MQSFIVISILFCSLIYAEYSTNFTSFDSKNWKLETGCNHCSHDNGIECTNYTVSAAQFGSVSAGTGVTITTKPIDKVKCGGICQSAHLGYIAAIKYGKIEFRSRWFPGDQNDVKTGEGYVGLDGSGNEDSIYFGFDGSTLHSFKTTAYTNGPGHGEENIDTGTVDIDNQFQMYQLEWLQDKITWTFNGKVVRTVTDKNQIPSVPLKLAIHSRSSHCDQMPKDSTLFTQHLYFKYTEESELREMV